MTGWVLLAAVGLAVAVWVGQPSAVPQRLTVARHAESLPGRASAGRRLTSPGGRRASAVAAGVAVAILVPSWWGLVAAGAVAGVLDQWLGGLPGRASVVAEQAARHELPLALDLMAAALTAGAPTVAAVELAARGAGPPLSRALLDIVVSLRLGASPEEAWRAARADAVLQPLARLAVRSATSGAVMAQACRDLAMRQRQVQAADAEAAIKRAGVLAVLPLALCFLPAFVLVGVVPIVVGLLSSLSL